MVVLEESILNQGVEFFSFPLKGFMCSLSSSTTAVFGDFVEPLAGKKSLPDEMVAMECFPMLSGGVKINKYGAGGLQEAAVATLSRDIRDIRDLGIKYKGRDFVCRHATWMPVTRKCTSVDLQNPIKFSEAAQGVPKQSKSESKKPK